MEIQEYIDEKKELQDLLLSYIDGRDDSEIDFHFLINHFENQEIRENPDEFKALIHLLLRITNNHYRYRGFFKKIEQIILYFQNDIKQTFSNTEIFNLFKNNKRIVLFLIKNNIITIDKSITDLMIEQSESKDKKCCHYFFPEIKPFLNLQTLSVIQYEVTEIYPDTMTNFDMKREIGENENYICALIRADEVENFISHVTQKNLQLFTKIEQSIFETNSFLINKKPSLIEYAAFFGSIQIFKYLKFNGVTLESSLWSYAIHGKNADLIHLLEECHIKPENNSYERCLEESIKCHHNDITNYIHDNFSSPEELSKNIQFNFCKNFNAYSFHYYNYEYFPSSFDNRFILHYLCEYDYTKLVELLLKSKTIDVNQRVKKISNILCFKWNSRLKLF